mmetsp:Transcript_100640/g.262958  ORF Transcript_100640/g.262958 Transcript_100640/m.262958 type:complete len:433 (+) Transcript_100640:127-1425(+)
MVHCYSAEALLRRRLRAADRGYLRPRLCEAGHRLLRVSCSELPRVRAFVTSIELHDKHDELNGWHSHFARDATRIADGIGEQDRRLALIAHQKANSAKHNGRLHPHCSTLPYGNDVIDELFVNDPWAASRPSSRRTTGFSDGNGNICSTSQRSVDPVSVETDGDAKRIDCSTIKNGALCIEASTETFFGSDAISANEAKCIVGSSSEAICSACNDIVMRLAAVEKLLSKLVGCFKLDSEATNLGPTPDAMNIGVSAAPLAEPCEERDSCSDLETTVRCTARCDSPPEVTINYDASSSDDFKGNDVATPHPLHRSQHRAARPLVEGFVDSKVEDDCQRLLDFHADRHSGVFGRQLRFGKSAVHPALNRERIRKNAISRHRRAVARADVATVGLADVSAVTAEVGSVVGSNDDFEVEMTIREILADMDYDMPEL